MKSINKQIKQFILLSGIILLSSPVFATESGIVKGRVTDKKNHPIEYATASLKNLETLKTQDGAMCDKNGNFVIEDVKPGKYALSISMIGYKKCDVRNITIDENQKNVEESFLLKDSTQHLRTLVVAAKRRPTAIANENKPTTLVSGKTGSSDYYNNLMNVDWSQYYDLTRSIKPVLYLSKFIICCTL